MSNTIVAIASLDLARVTGGAGTPDFNSIRKQAQAYCPNTAAKYANTDPASVTRPLAQQMGNACLAEMGPFKAMVARGQINSAIDQAYPAK